MSEPNRCCTDSPPEEDGLEKTGKAYRKQDMEVVERALVRLRRAEFRCDWSAEEESWDHLLNAGAIHKLMILPIYSWIQWWDLVIVLCVFWSAFIVPFRLAFLEFDEDPSSNEWFAADIIVDMLYICDTAMHFFRAIRRERDRKLIYTCLLYTSDAADEEDSVDLGGRRIIKKKKKRIEPYWLKRKQQT
eukprot:TRINITY_DN5546_c0_g1_i4.p1 TRINITY_DN5546_c0_g1~~TRINITY_DN5546_c0_g1_i4.p1  ORF type:complete len:189 (-),score=50.63 TRINITY_DN5546_c0_g1_i4:72-638(-)